MMERITTIGSMRLPSRVWLAAICLPVAGMPRLVAAEEAVRYSARPVLAEVVLGGRAVPVSLDVRDGSSADTDYRGLSLWPGEFPLNIGVTTAPPGGPPVVRLRSRLEGWEDEWQDHESQMWLVLRFLGQDNRAVSSAAFIPGRCRPWSAAPAL
jgi:hypothetical protein